MTTIRTIGRTLVGSRHGNGTIVVTPVGRWTCRIRAVDTGDGTVTSVEIEGTG
jgi:hypothetical protein